MQPFSYTALPGKVIFGSGTLARVADEIRALGCGRALLLSTPQQADQVRRLFDQLGPLAAGLFTEAAMHTPVEVTERALAYAREVGADCTVALGGGSTTGLGKAIAVRIDLPQVVIPTTYAGSEATPIVGETKDGLKTTQRSMTILPEVIIYDVDLTMTLPPGMTVTSGMNAIAHAAEGLYAKDANPIISMIAEDGTRAIARALPRIIADPSDREARSDALYGAWACGVTLGAVGMSLHHKLCHTLGGTFDLPHAETHTVVLPHAMAYNAPAAPQAMGRLAAAIGAPNAPQGLYDLAKSLGAPTSLRELGMPQSGLDRVVEMAVANPYWNPRPLEPAPMRRLLEDAWHGRRPPEAI
ncbi:MAG TPA: maleylacetate reductase [Caulobacteraceae bacterium]|jgi:alcohol dehydrogenase class IV|nr:maleylacetate reductase [Caulobacteraceae bacterium]